MKQKEVTNFDQLDIYLAERRQMWTGLYHYTSLETLIRILRSGKLLLNNTCNLNDNMESKVDMHFPDCHLYVASLTYESSEDVHYWAVYGRGDHFSVRLRFDPTVLMNPDNMLFVDENDKMVDVKKTMINDVIYCKPKKGGYTWNHHNSEFSLDAEPDIVNQRFVGMWKYAVWQHEKETRILTVSKTSADQIFLRLSDDMLNSMSVTFSPWLLDDVRPDITKMLIEIFRDKYNMKKINLVFRRSSIYKQIKQIR